MTIRSAFLVGCNWCGYGYPILVDTAKEAWHTAVDDGWMLRHGDHVCPSCATWRDTTTVQGATCVAALGPDASGHPPAGTSSPQQAREWREGR